MSDHGTEAKPSAAIQSAAASYQVDPASGGLVGAAEPAVQPADSDTAEVEPTLGDRIATLSAGVWFCGGLLSLYTLYIGRNLFVPVTVAVFAYLTLRPIVRGATKVGVPPAL